MRYTRVVAPQETYPERARRRQLEKDLALRVKRQRLALFGPGRESYPGRVEYFRGKCTRCNRAEALLWQVMALRRKPNGVGHVVAFGDRICAPCIAELHTKNQLWKR